MKKTVVYLSLGIAAASAGAIAVAAIEEVPNLLNNAIQRAVAERLHQPDAGEHKIIRVGAGSG